MFPCAILVVLILSLVDFTLGFFQLSHFHSTMRINKNVYHDNNKSKISMALIDGAADRIIELQGELLDLEVNIYTPVSFHFTAD